MTDHTAVLQTALSDRYRFERELGRGGMATVYLARDLKHDRPVALKVVKPELAASLGGERFLREIRTAARLQHPHILTVLDSGEAGQRGSGAALWFTMPYVEGETLRERLRREGQLPLGEAIRIATEVSRALDYAHAHGVIHRDIKPENILLGDDGTTLVGDFGIAKAMGGAAGQTGGGAERELTDTGVMVGTPAYMSPEQASGERELDGRTDVYSLGCVLYEMLAGEPPFTGGSAQAVIAKRLMEPAPHIGTLRQVPWEVERAVTQALARSPADRWHAAGALATALAEYGAPVAPRTRPSVVRWAAISLAAAATGAAAAWAALSRPWEPRRADSVAVLPFENLSPDAENEYFSDGMTEELITALSRVEGLRVAARTSSFALKGRNPDVGEVRSRLGVETVLAGSVRRAGGRLRVTAELVDARDGYRMWAAAFDRQPGDAFAVQQELSEAIAEELRGHLEPGAVPGRRHPPDAEAYDLYLRGRHAWRRRTRDGLLEARDLFERAIARDPSLARAHAGLADAFVVMTLWSDVPPGETYPRAKAAALQALALDSMLAEPHATLGNVHTMYEWDWPAAERRFKRALELDPSSGNTYHWYGGDYLAAVGRLEEAVKTVERGRELDPLSVTINASYGLILYRVGRYGEALEHLESVRSMDPEFALVHSGIGQVHLIEGRYAEALEALERSVDSSVRHSADVALVGMARAMAGRREGAESLLVELRQRDSAGYVSPAGMALLHLGLGDTAQAWTSLERAAEVRDPLLVYLFVSDPLLAGLREEERGEALLASMGLREPAR